MELFNVTDKGTWIPLSRKPMCNVSIQLVPVALDMDEGNLEAVKRGDVFFHGLVGHLMINTEPFKHDNAAALWAALLGISDVIASHISSYSWNS